MNKFTADLRSAIAQMERDYMCSRHACYMPEDVSIWKAPLWNLLSRSLSDAHTRVGKGNEPVALLQCIDIMMKDDPPPAKHGRNPLYVARRMLAVVEAATVDAK